MRAFSFIANGSALVAFFILSPRASSQEGVPPPLGPNQTFIRWVTNGPVVTALFTNPPPSGFVTNTDGTVRRRPVSRVLPKTLTRFDHYLPDSLNYMVWTNFIAHTNGRSTLTWAQRTHPAGWPTSAPIGVWNTNSLMWGMKGMTALSLCWELEGLPGQAPLTALTRRHAYSRGHSMGPEGFRTNYTGRKVWFVTRDNKVVERTIAREVVRNPRPDYTIVILTEDLPMSIEPLRVTDRTELANKYPDGRGGYNLRFFSEQGGHISAGVPGFMVNVGKGGDSGSAIMLPTPGELLFVAGLGTEPPSAAMQADMDKLCQMEGLDPRPYQMEWVHFPGYPSYSSAMKQNSKDLR